MVEVSSFNLAELIPHSGNMVLLDSVLAFDENSVTVRTQVRHNELIPGNLVFVPAWFGIEYMAQTIGVYAGLHSKQANEPIKIGFLLGTRRYQSNVSQLLIGTQLTVHAEKIIHNNALGVFDCRISGEDVEIKANLNVYQPSRIDNE